MVLDRDLGVNFYIPISLTDANFEAAVQIDADRSSKFHFRKYFSRYLHGKDCSKDEWVHISMLEFLEGSQDFTGMRQLARLSFICGPKN